MFYVEPGNFFRPLCGQDYFFSVHTMLEIFFETIFFFLMGRMRARLFFSIQALYRLFFFGKNQGQKFFSKMVYFVHMEVSTYVHLVKTLIFFGKSLLYKIKKFHFYRCITFAHFCITFAHFFSYICALFFLHLRIFLSFICELFYIYVQIHEMHLLKLCLKKVTLVYLFYTW